MELPIDKIICGDCIEVMKTFPDESLDLIYADPPFNLKKKYAGHINDNLKQNEYNDWCAKWIKPCYDILKPNGSIYISNIPKNSAWLFVTMHDLGLIFWDWIVWEIGTWTFQKHYNHRHEDLLFFVKGNEPTFNLDDIRVPPKGNWGGKEKFLDPRGMKCPDIWTEIKQIYWQSKERIHGANLKSKHPVQKPEKFMARIIKASSNKGNIVLDPFVGTGTTCVVAKKLGRKYIGIDINCDYVEMAKKRINNIPEKLSSFFKGAVK